MATTKRRKQRRYAAATAKRVTLAEQRRESAKLAGAPNLGYVTDSQLDAIREGAESKHALRVRLHECRVRYTGLDDDTFHAHRTRSYSPMVRVQTTTRKGQAAKIAARNLRDWHNLAKEHGVSKAQMIKEFKAKRPHDAKLLSL